MPGATPAQEAKWSAVGKQLISLPISETITSVLGAIGNTPLIEISRLTHEIEGRFLAKLEYLHTKYFSELVKGIFLAETRDRFVSIAEQLKLTKGIEGLVLGGTEIPLLREVSNMTLPLLDTTQLHGERVACELL